MSEEKPLSVFMQQAFNRLGMRDLSDEMAVERVYNEAAGELIARMTLSLKFQAGTLRLKVTSAALKNELTMRREGLRLKLNESLGREVVKKIVVE
ncbi:MAG: DUF721 domain-containing protein [Bacteroidales bacterium]|nr:DUF721 domain-containing protein [Bacteroidales bacterium]